MGTAMGTVILEGTHTKSLQRTVFYYLDRKILLQCYIGFFPSHPPLKLPTLKFKDMANSKMRVIVVAYINHHYELIHIISTSLLCFNEYVIALLSFLRMWKYN